MKEIKGFSFKILYIGVFAPSILYLLTLPYLELWFQRSITQTIRQELVQNSFELLRGTVSLYDEVNGNVGAVLSRSRVRKLGAEVRVRINDAYENIIYPYYDRLLFDRSEGTVPVKTPGPLFDEQGLAQHPPGGDLEEFLQQYSEYIRGMTIVVDVGIPVSSWLGTVALLVFILVTVLLLYFYYERSAKFEERRLREIEIEHEVEKRSISEQVERKLEEARRRLLEVQSQEEVWLQEVERLEKEKNSIEEELLETLEQTEEQKEKIGELEEKVVKGAGKKPRSVREEKVLNDRFRKLYRKLEVDSRAVDDLVQFRDDKLKLQAEAALKCLNDGDPNLKVRRKIAGVEKCDAYELGFGSSGRIYYIQTDRGQYRILRIGTKASQSKDLAYLQGKKNK